MTYCYEVYWGLGSVKDFSKFFSLWLRAGSGNLCQVAPRKRSTRWFCIYIFFFSVLCELHSRGEIHSAMNTALQNKTILIKSFPQFFVSSFQFKYLKRWIYWRSSIVSLASIFCLSALADFSTCCKDKQVKMKRLPEQIEKISIYLRCSLWKLNINLYYNKLVLIISRYFYCKRSQRAPL